MIGIGGRKNKRKLEQVHLDNTLQGFYRNGNREKQGRVIKGRYFYEKNNSMFAC